MSLQLTPEQSIAAMHLALDALADSETPAVLRSAAWRFVHHGEAALFLALLQAAWPATLRSTDHTQG